MKFLIDDPFGYEVGRGCDSIHEGWICTRPFGHKSWHIATIEDHAPIVAWYDGKRVWKASGIRE